MKRALLICLLLLPFASADHGEGPHIIADAADVELILWSDAGEVMVIEAGSPLNLSLGEGAWTMARHIDGVPQTERISLSDGADIDAWLAANYTPVEVAGSATLDVLGTIAPSTSIQLDHSLDLILPGSLGSDLLPDAHLGIREQVDLHLGDGDGELNQSEVDAFAALLTPADCCHWDRVAPTLDAHTVALNLGTGSTDVRNHTWTMAQTSTWNATSSTLSNRLLWVPFDGGVNTSVDLAVTLPEGWEASWSPQFEFFSGSPSQFTIARSEMAVTGDVTITLGQNAAPSATFESDRNLPVLPHGELSEVHAVCSDTSFAAPTPTWRLEHDGTVLFQNMSESTLSFDPLIFGITAGEWVNLTLTCTDPQGLATNYSDLLYLDGEAPTRQLGAHWVHGSVEGAQMLNLSEREIVMPAGSSLTFFGEAYDDAPLPVEIRFTSNKSAGWHQTRDGTISWTDLFNQGSHVNGMHLSEEERHTRKDQTNWSLDLLLTDAAGNQVSESWNLRITDSTAPMPKPALFVNGAHYGVVNRAVTPANVTVDLAPSYDDLDPIEAVTWTAFLDGEPLFANASWNDVSTFELENLGPGVHSLTVRATDSAGNTRAHVSEIEVDPPAEPVWEIHTIHVSEDPSMGSPGHVDVTVRNHGGIAGNITLCAQMTCTDWLPGAAATVEGPAEFSHRIEVTSWASGPVDVTLNWEAEDSEGSISRSSNVHIPSTFQRMSIVLIPALLIIGGVFLLLNQKRD